MPIYEYECSKCGHRFEEIEHFDSPTRRKCPKCGLTAHRMMPTGVGLVFKGSGFYTTDYARKSAEKKESEKGKKPDVTERD
jgi:putative FmdB family regulatory protein